MSKTEEDIYNYFYKIHAKSSNASSWHVVHTVEDVAKFIKAYEDRSGYGFEWTITRPYGWDEEERKELARLKAKYEPENRDV